MKPTNRQLQREFLSWLQEDQPRFRREFISWLQEDQPRFRQTFLASFPTEDTPADDNIVCDDTSAFDSDFIFDSEPSEWEPFVLNANYGASLAILHKDGRSFLFYQDDRTNAICASENGIDVFTLPRDGWLYGKLLASFPDALHTLLTDHQSRNHAVRGFRQLKQDRTPGGTA